MDKEVIGTALNSALYLLHSELETVCVDDLKDEYEQTIAQLNQALAELNKE